MLSKKANKYGTPAEHHMIEERDLVAARCYWHDATFRNGMPVEIKSCDVASTGYFQIYERAHDQLLEHDGWYAFAPYTRSGMRVLKVWMRRASKMPPMQWSSTGGHRDSRKTKVDVSRVMRS
ncbi:hypothetical protein [Halorubellus litoreus]|uniref:Uncharacterized protein n=1 Tax=Halorubellus litoreus TaxID=755308 RepID=A0ABD5VKN9_9EURY